MVESCALEKKSDLLNILVKDTQNDPPDFVDVKLLDGAAVVHFLHTANVLTFDQYADQVFLPYVMSEQTEQHAPAPEGWGWTLHKDSQSWAPVWNVLPVASKAG